MRSGPSEGFDRVDLETKDFQGLKTSGESLWGKTNYTDEPKRQAMIEGLKNFQKKNPEHDEAPYIKKLKEARNNGELMQIEAKMKRAAIKWYIHEIDESRVFDPVDDRETTGLARERKQLIEMFAGLPLAGDDFSMTSVLARLKDDLKVKKEFRAKLRKQSGFVKNEYARRLGSLGLVGSKEALLEEVLVELKGVEDKPSAVQYEFKKRQRSADENQETSTIQAEVYRDFETRATKYHSQILANTDYFGGEEVDSKWGKVPLTAKEFMEWFKDLESFAAMDDAVTKLPALIAQRKKVYANRDKILKEAKPADRNRLEKLTKKMRRHELEDYLPTLEESVQEDNVHVAEYVGEITTAKAKGINLYTEFEQAMMKNKFKLNDLETQKAKLTILQSEVAERSQVVEQYMSLPAHMRNDQRFMDSHSIDREVMLVEAIEQKAKQPNSPFEINGEGDLDTEKLGELAQSLESGEGAKVMNEIMDDLSQSGEVNDSLEDTYWKIFGTAKRAETYNETQKESYERDLRFWVRLDQGKKDESDAMSARERSKIRFMEEASRGYDLGYTVTSGGIVHDVQDISEIELRNGNEKIDEKLNKAKYGEHVRINKADGQMAEDPLDLIERLSEQDLQRVVLMAVKKLSQGYMNLGESGTNYMRNSKQIQESMRNRLIDREYTQLKKVA